MHEVVVAEVSGAGREENHGNYAQQWLQDAHNWTGCMAHGRKSNQRNNSQFHQNWLSPFRLRWYSSVPNLAYFLRFLIYFRIFYLLRHFFTV